MSNFVSILHNLDQWGYWLVCFGALFEGEVILLSASAAAALGYLDIYKVFIVAFFTTVVTDQMLFLLGKKMGSDWLIKRFPKLEKPRDTVLKMLSKMDVFFIFAFRFIYGIRTVSPIILGSAKIPFHKFSFWNVLSGLCWASLGCWLGYSVAELIEAGNFHPGIIFVCITVGFVLLSFIIGFLVHKKLKF